MACCYLCRNYICLYKRRKTIMIDFKKLTAKYLREVADKIDGGSCELSETEAMNILKVIAHEPLSKEQACRFLNISRSRFDDLVREGKLPRGRKRVGLKELSWWKDELEKCRLK